MEDLYQQFKEAGCRIENYFSDMYVEISEVSTKIVQTITNSKRIASFKHQIHLTMWYEFPLRYTPFWEEVERKAEKRRKK